MKFFSFNYKKNIQCVEMEKRICTLFKSYIDARIWLAEWMSDTNHQKEVEENRKGKRTSCGKESVSKRGNKQGEVNGSWFSPGKKADQRKCKIDAVEQEIAALLSETAQVSGMSMGDMITTASLLHENIKPLPHLGRIANTPEKVSTPAGQQVGALTYADASHQPPTNARRTYVALQTTQRHRRSYYPRPVATPNTTTIFKQATSSTSETAHVHKQQNAVFAEDPSTITGRKQSQSFLSSFIEDMDSITTPVIPPGNPRGVKNEQLPRTPVNHRHRQYHQRSYQKLEILSSDIRKPLGAQEINIANRQNEIISAHTFKPTKPPVLSNRDVARALFGSS